MNREETVNIEFLIRVVILVLKNINVIEVNSSIQKNLNFHIKDNRHAQEHGASSQASDS